ncbi:MAG: transposase [Syntrophales bacterium]|nr:transposase [Syntrophales bacterium]
MCTQNRSCLFWKIENREMIDKWWNELKYKYRNIELHEQIIMPDHSHGIIQIINKTVPVGSPLHVMIQWFKTMTTNEYIRGVKNNGWSRFNKKLWQRNYYEHIIRDEESCYQISEYIQTNPMKWQDDKYYV